MEVQIEQLERVVDDVGFGCFLRQDTITLLAALKRSLERREVAKVVLAQTPGAWQEFVCAGGNEEGVRVVSSGAPKPRGKRLDYAKPVEVHIFDRQGEPIPVVL